MRGWRQHAHCRLRSSVASGSHAEGRVRLVNHLANALVELGDNGSVIPLWVGQRVVNLPPGRRASQTGACYPNVIPRVALRTAENHEVLDFVGAGDGIRTHDPNLGKVVLYP